MLFAAAAAAACSPGLGPGPGPSIGGRVPLSRVLRRDVAAAELASDPARQQLPAWARAVTPANNSVGSGRDRRGSGGAAGGGLPRKDSGVRGRMIIGGAGGGGRQMGHRRSSRGKFFEIKTKYVVQDVCVMDPISETRTGLAGWRGSDRTSQVWTIPGEPLQAPPPVVKVFQVFGGGVWFPPSSWIQIWLSRRRYIECNRGQYTHLACTSGL